MALRVSVLISAPIAVISPLIVASEPSPTFTSTGRPRVICTNQNCGTGKFTRTVLVACRETNSPPTCKSCPRSTLPIPRRPSNGARTTFLSSVALRSLTSPCADSICCKAASNSLCDTVLRLRNSSKRSWLDLAKRKRASAALNCACSLPDSCKS